ncbi:MAG: hypothetical protein JWQ24_2717 [Tardiphaga sp.]|nr:hypothetical protein [Tardiphaga sp.]
MQISSNEEADEFRRLDYLVANLLSGGRILTPDENFRWNELFNRYVFSPVYQPSVPWQARTY